MTKINVNDAVCEAIFASPLQPSETLTADRIAAAIGSTIRRLSRVGCTKHVAEEFGDHPEEAASRMRWARQLTSELSQCLFFPTATPATAASAGTDLLPVCDAA